MCKFIQAKAKALICAHNTGTLKLNGMAQASLYIYLCTFPTQQFTAFCMSNH